MNALIFRHLTIVALLLSLAGPSVVSAATQAASGNHPDSGKLTIDFRDIELVDLILTMSELTGRNFLYDETVRGKATIISPDSMTVEEAYQLFLAVLNSKGFTVVQSGKVYKVVPHKTAKESEIPTVFGGPLKGSEQFLTRVIRLEHLDAASFAATVLAPLLPPSGNLIAYPPTNTVIVTDRAGNIDRMLSIIDELDQPDASGNLEIIHLNHADAEDVALICNDILAQGPTSGAQTTRRIRRDPASPPGQETAGKVVPYKRTNSLIVLAGASDMDILKGLITQIDQDQGGRRSNINLYSLENADATALAATLNEILSGIRNQGGQTGAAAQSPLSSAPVTISADKPTNSLIINASPTDYDTIRDIIRKLDIKRKQVYVEALILELSMDATLRLGASLQGGVSVDGEGLAFGTSNLNKGPVGLGDMVQDSTTGLPSVLTTAIDGLLAGGFFKTVTVTGPNGNPVTVPALSALIDLAKTDSNINILSAPRLLTSDNEEAEIIVGSNVPIITGRLTDTGGGSGLAQSVTVQRQDVALILRFTPQVTEGDLVRLNIYQELTDIVPASAGLSASVGNPNEVGPTFTKRVLRNTVLAENGRSVVLGGLIDTNVSESISKVPLLGDIPVLGWLFKRKSTQTEKTNLLIFINPTIIKDREDLARVTRRNQSVSETLISEKTQQALPQGYFEQTPSSTDNPSGRSQDSN